MRKILLQTCCAPCVTTCVKILKGELLWDKALEMAPNFDEICIYFYNPNIHPEEEYHKRSIHTKVYADKVECSFVEGKYEPEIFYDKVQGLEMEPEKGRRCSVCYAMRLEKSFLYALEHGFDAVASTLTLSPYKDAEKVNNIGKNLAKKTNVEYLVSNFKKNNGFAISKQISKDKCIYCQNYCGCSFSLQEKLSKQS